MGECCPSQSHDTEEIARYFRERMGSYEKRHRKGLGAESRAIAEALIAQGVEGKSLLEIGPGFGDLTFELLRAGVSKAQGVDLSPEMVEVAREHASRMGYSSKTTFDVGNGAETPLQRADIVVLDKVMCCYRVLEPLLNNSVSACAFLYGFSVPNDRGGWKFFLRVAFAVERVSLWLRRCKAYTYFHSTDVMGSVLVQHGFRLVYERGIRGWLVRVYKTDRSMTQTLKSVS